MTIPLLAFAALAASEPVPRLTISADFATVNVPVQPAGRHLMRLPSLEFAVRIAPNCPAGTAVNAVSVTVADSRHVFRGEAFAGNGVLETSLAVPAQQLAPMPLESACSAEQPGAPHTLSIPGALTAHASLRCSAEEEHTVHYEALSLGVEIVCPGSDGTEAPAGAYSPVSASTCDRNSTVLSQASAAACAS